MMERKGLRIIKRSHVVALLILAFTFLNMNASFAQELPKSWMPKWKVGDWWRVKVLLYGPQGPGSGGMRFFKFEVIGKENIDGGQGLKIEITDEKSPKFTATFILNKHLAVRRRIERRGPPKDGKDYIDNFHYKGAYPYVGGERGMLLPAFPLVVGKREYNPNLPKERKPYIQDIRKVSGKELSSRGYKFDGMFKPEEIYYEVTLYDYDYGSKKRYKRSVQIWSPDAPYWVYCEEIATKAWLIDHSWK